jgi:hypothetical protein
MKEGMGDRGQRGAYMTLVGKLHGKSPLWRLKNYIKTGITETICEDVKWLSVTPTVDFCVGNFSTADVYQVFKKNPVPETELHKVTEKERPCSEGF